MNEKDAIRKAMEKRNITQMELAKLAGYKTQSSVSNLLNLNKNGARIDKVIPLLDAMDFHLEVVDNKDSSERWVIDGKHFDPAKWEKTSDGYKCPICGAASSAPSKFCPNCGHKFKDVSVADSAED